MWTVYVYSDCVLQQQSGPDSRVRQGALGSPSWILFTAAPPAATHSILAASCDCLAGEPNVLSGSPKHPAEGLPVVKGPSDAFILSACCRYPWSWSQLAFCFRTSPYDGTFYDCTLHVTSLAFCHFLLINNISVSLHLKNSALTFLLLSLQCAVKFVLRASGLKCQFINLWLLTDFFQFTHLR